MGTPNSLDSAIGTAKVAMGAFDVSQWVKLVLEVLEFFKTEIKYFGKEVMLGSGLSCWGSKDDVRKIEPKHINWPDHSDIGLYDKVFHLLNVVIDETEKEEVEREYRWRKTEIRVYVNRNAELIIIKIRFDCTLYIREPSRHNLNEEASRRCKIFKPNVDELKELMGKDTNLGLKILRQLYELVEKTIQSREERIKRQKGKRDWLGGILNRISE